MSFHSRKQKTCSENNASELDILGQTRMNFAFSRKSVFSKSISLTSDFLGFLIFSLFPCNPNQLYSCTLSYTVVSCDLFPLPAFLPSHCDRWTALFKVPKICPWTHFLAYEPALICPWGIVAGARNLWLLALLWSLSHFTIEEENIIIIVLYFIDHEVIVYTTLNHTVN